MVGLIGGEWALAAAGAIFVAAALVMIRLPDPSTATEAHGPIVRNAWLGLRYVARNPTLRGLALTLSTVNLGSGILQIAVPVRVLSRFHEGPASVGLLWGAMGAAGLVSALVAGRIATLGRERTIMMAGIVLTVLAVGSLPFAIALPAVVVALVVLGAATGPFDVSLFTLRQRRTDPAWFGRAFAVSMSVNYIGSPIGSALAGPLIERSLDIAIWIAVAVTVLAGVLAFVSIPAREDTRVPQA